MLYKCIVILTLTFTVNSVIAQEQYESEEILCPAAKEYITTINFLREREEKLGFTEKEMREAAFQVSKGCLGAAERFIRTFDTMMKTQAAARGSLQVAIDLSKKSENYTDAFLEIFKKSYLAEHLDLDYKTSLDMAKSLSIEYSGDPDKAQRDFLNLVKFCTSDKWLGMSKPRCGVMAGRVVKSAELFNREIAPLFEKLFAFIVSEKGPTPDLVKALDITEEVISYGPEAPENFIMAYRYGLNDEGLKLTALGALNFAKKMSAHAKWTEKDPERLPANQNE